MSRDFIIRIDSSNLSGTINGVTEQLPFIRHVNSVPSLKDTKSPYLVYNGGKEITNDNEK